MFACSLGNFFHIDALALIIITLVGYIGITVVIYAARYMKGDVYYYKFLILLVLLIFSVMVMAASDNIFIFLASWSMSNCLLVRLMMHNSRWQAAINSASLAAKTFAIGFVSLIAAFFLFYYCTGQTSIQLILRELNLGNTLAIVGMVLMFVAAMSQSGIWPFHRWLISSLNSPTPVSAIMHAGLVNGGGFLLIRFAGIYFSEPTILTIIFILGFITATIATLWKLMQNNIKRMLACSTMAQMGFMIAQCGLGLFPTAVAHLCWHSLFKANLFLCSNAARAEKRLPADCPPNTTMFFLSLICGLFAGYVFSTVNHISWLAGDTTLIVLVLVIITGAQFALKLLTGSPWKKFPATIFVTGMIGLIYGFSVHLIEFVLPLKLMHPQHLNIFYWMGLIFSIAMWLVMLFPDSLMKVSRLSKLIRILYVKALNASQPHSATITSQRNQYRI